MEKKNFGQGTLAVHGGQEPDASTGSRAVPIYSTAAYSFQDTSHAGRLFALEEFGNIYSRIMNPTCDVLEKRLAALEGGTMALTFASGMAAITAAVLTITHAGQNFISAKSLYGGTWTAFTQTLPRLGVEVRLFDTDRPEEIEKHVDEHTRCVYIESLGNPKCDIPDFQRIAEISHTLGLPLLVDNTVLTPVLCKPLEHGADIVLYSTTKYIGGHGVHVGGAVVDGGRFDWTADAGRWPELNAPDPSYHGKIFAKDLAPFGNIAYTVYMRTHWLRDMGACMSPFAAFLFLIGLETLHLRMPRHVDNTRRVAEWLRKHPAVEWVNYPGLQDHPHHGNALKYTPNGPGAILGFQVKGGRPAGERLINSVELASHLANIGDAKTLIIHPASTTHQQLSAEEQEQTGVTPGFIRLCVGIEDAQDIIDDLDQALAASQKQG